MQKNILLFLCITLHGIAQNKEAIAIKNTIQKAENFLSKMQPDSAFIYATKAQKLAENSSDKAFLATSYLTVANVWYKKSNKNQAAIFGKKAEVIANEIKNSEILWKAYLLLGNIHMSKFEDAEAISYYQKIENLSSKSGIENITVVKAIENTGLLFLRGYEEGIKSPNAQAQAYFLSAYNLAKKIQEKDEQHIAGSYLGSTYVENKEFQKALQLYDQGYAHFKKKGDLKNQTTLLWAYASLYRLWDKKDLAEKYYLENIKINSVPNNFNGLARAHWAYAGYFIQNKNYPKAITQYETAIALFKKEKNMDVGPYSGSLYELAKAYEQIGDYKNAYPHLENYLIYNDSLNAKQNKEAFTEIEVKYQTEKKEQEIQLLSEQKQKQNILYLSILTLLIATGLFLFYGYRNKIKTAEKRKELNELKSRFFANISHEFRTPLTLIQSPVQSLQSEITNEAQRKQLQLIERNSNRMLELVEQLLQLSKLDSGHLQLILKEGNISSFLHSILESFEYKAKENSIAFHTSIAKSSQNYFFDKDIIEKIVINLVSNAFKYSQEKEVIRFSSSYEENNLKLVISNSGTTLQKEELPRIFERFYKKNNTASGSGIGLALVKELVELYQGTIETTIENHNLIFTITLPLETPPTNSVKLTNTLDIPEENSVIVDNDLPILLLVEDNAEIRSVLKDIFKTNFTVLEAEDGEKALKIARKEIPDCIISDIMMPNMNGYDFTKAIKANELTSFIPVILLTAKTSKEAHLEGLQSTADAFLTKPFDNDIVKATVFQLISERKKLQERYSQDIILRPVDIVINSVDEKFLEKLQEILQKELSNSEFSADDFATTIGMSRMQLHRKLKTLLGVSTTEFLRTERLKTAKELLKKGDGTISEIAYSVGFNDVSYFSKCFKEKFQCTPSEYIESTNS